MSRRTLVLLVSALFTALIVASNYTITSAEDRTALLFDSPISTPTPADPLAELARQHVAEQQAIPIEELQVAGSETLHFPMLGRTYQHVVVVHSQAGATQVYTVLVDPATSQVEIDVDAVRKAEAAAYVTKYGKLEPALYERMQRAAAGERLPVGVWLSFGAAEFQPEAIAAEVAKQFPEAAAALAQRGAPWAVDDPELAKAILHAYSQRLNDAVNRRAACRLAERRGLCCVQARRCSCG